MGMEVGKSVGSTEGLLEGDVGRLETGKGTGYKVGEGSGFVVGEGEGI